MAGHEVIAYRDTFVLFAELSLALAGFAGVAAAFGGRDRSFKAIDLNRLTGLFVNAGITLAGALLVLTFDAMPISETRAFLIVSGLCCALVGIVMIRTVPGIYRLARDPDVSYQTGVAHFISSTLGAIGVLYGSNVWLGGEAWPLLAGFSLQLLFGLWMFGRLLMRSN